MSWGQRSTSMTTGIWALAAMLYLPILKLTGCVISEQAQNSICFHHRYGFHQHPTAFSRNRSLVNLGVVYLPLKVTKSWVVSKKWNLNGVDGKGILPCFVSSKVVYGNRGLQQAVPGITSPRGFVPSYLFSFCSLIYTLGLGRYQWSR